MGTRGPVPKRTDQRLGHLTKAEKAAATTVKVTGAVDVPAVDPSWHLIAQDWYMALATSAQSKLMEPSDWVAARLVAAEMTRMLSGAPNAAMFGKIWAAMGELMTTEGARRRLKIEVDRRKLSAAPAPVAKIDDYRDL
jgi:hypothetical protein